MQSYTEQAYDDTVCACGAKLPETVEPFTWSDHGFCGLGCAIQCAGPFRLRATVVSVELARSGGGRGPGFEDAILNPLIAQVTKDGGMLALDKLRSEDDPKVPTVGRWSWRLYRTDARGTFCECAAFRLTPRAEYES